MLDPLLTVPEVAEQLSVTEETVRRWLRDDRLEGTRLSRRAGWRIRQSAVDKLLEEFSQEGKLAA